jgi:polyphosphate kinase
VQAAEDASAAEAAEPAPVDLDDPSLYINRELSWQDFNARVLAQAEDRATPLLERLRFLAVFSTNLDEFFMVRVAALLRQVEAGVTRRTPDGRTPAEQLEAIAAQVHPMVAAAAECLQDRLLPLLSSEGLSLLSIRDLDAEQRAHLDGYFEEQVFPVLTPLAVDPAHPFPYISNLSLSLAVTVFDPGTGERRFARVKVPLGVLPRFVPMPGGGGGSPGPPGTHAWVPLEELITAEVGRLFPGMEVLEAHPFRVTRNADLEIQEDEADDLLLAIQQELRRRRFGAVVRLEVAEDMTERMVSVLQEELGVTDLDTYRVPGLLGLGDLEELADQELPHLRFAPWPPLPHPRLPDEEAPTRGVFAAIRQGDILVQHPYHGFKESIERFVAAAADDADVVAIKQTLYRTSGDSPFVRSLIRAAERGKQVVALIELKARFDEEANIYWARALEKAGVHVVYGLVGLKTHVKTTLVVRRERDGIRRYVHIGTGNYNAATANLYTDLGLFSCRAPLGADVSDLFNVLTGYAHQDAYRELLVAPASLRESITELIRREVDRHRAGQPGRIRLKLNALVDQRLIAELYRASQAGVEVDIVVRGICCLRPGVEGASDRIRVTSVIGRLLEHARIMQFGDDFWIGSADWMPRNLDRRVEALAPVQDPALCQHLRTILDLQLTDNVGAWTLDSDGRWLRRAPAPGEEPRNSQELLRLRHSDG